MDSRNSQNIKGIDISNWQEGANLQYAKNAGYDVVILKATEGATYSDKCFEGFYQQAKNVGMKVGAYHFMSESSDPARQARYFWDAIKDKQLDVIPVLDIESNQQGRSKASVTSRIIEFLEEFKSLSGIDCIIYSYTSFINSYIDNRVSGYKLWVAEYGRNDGSKQTPSDNNVWGNWDGFQYTSNGRISTFPGPVDLNEFKPTIFMDSANVPSQPAQPSEQGGAIGVGSRVRVIGSRYATGESIPGWVKQETYSVQQVGPGKVLLREIQSWVGINDVVLAGSNGSVQKGSRVKVVGTHYATGESIPGWVKEETYTVMQVSGSKALLREIMSWVYIKDLVIL